MEIVRRVRSMKELCGKARGAGRKIGIVPTMGALHEGHRQLIARARELSDVLVVSIFVNPTQFNEGKDFDGYPRSLTCDADLCIAEHVDYVFAPEVSELYPHGAQTFVEVQELAQRFEGASRPGHFRGVATVVLKLLEIVKPTVAVFGRKDYQQLVLICRMVRDLMLDVEIVGLETVRDTDGLALSSRNARLTADERRAALAIPRALEAATAAFDGGQRSGEKIAAAARTVLEAEERLRLDYVEVVDADSLEPVSHLQDRAALLVAAHAGGTRLIDNTFFDPRLKESREND